MYCLNEGRLTPKPIDLSVLCDDNPMRWEASIESCSTATVVVTSFEDYGWAGVWARFEDAPDVRVNVYLADKDAVKINVGDKITVRGRINYMCLDNDIKFKHAIVIGSAISAPPCTFDARLVSVNSAE